MRTPRLLLAVLSAAACAGAHPDAVADGALPAATARADGARDPGAASAGAADPASTSSGAPEPYAGTSAGAAASGTTPSHGLAEGGSAPAARALAASPTVSAPLSATAPPTYVAPFARRAASGEVVLDLRSDGWPGRASSPVLVVGQARHGRAAHPEPTVLRFELPSERDLPQGAACSVWFGDDEVARFVAPAVAP
jgi:hypothetical protein